jgi:hypothetical protein
MNHPILIAALVEDLHRHRRCPCGAIARRPYDLCRECKATAFWRCEAGQPSRRTTSRLTYAGTGKARLFARVTSLVQIIGKGAES